MDLLVFSDLDGTLLDHETYDWSPARPGLDRLAQIGAGLVLASSKTWPEIDRLRRAIGIVQTPAIVENGAGVVWPDKAATDPGPEPEDAFGATANAPTDYDRLRALLAELPPGFQGFGDLGPAGVERVTGLPPQAARLACQRRFSEPGLWHGDAEGLDLFLTQAARAGIAARRGGRFLTLSFGRTKADAMAEVIARLKPGRTLALGDAPNDTEMLERADMGVVVANPSARPLPRLAGESEGRIYRTEHPGPHGWSEAILALTETAIDKTTGTEDKETHAHG